MTRFSRILVERFQNAPYSCSIPDADRVGAAGRSGGGPSMTIYLQLECEDVINASFRARGCGVTIACGSMLAEMLIGRSLSACRELTIDDLIAALDGIPADKRHAPVLAIAALHDALAADSGPGDGDCD